MRVKHRPHSVDATTWRVGRQRLAWRPTTSVLRMSGLLEGPLLIWLGVPALGLWLVLWTAALLASTLVWPARALTGRHLVVARRLDGPDPMIHRAEIRGRAEADALIRKWAAHLEQHGHLPR